MPTFIDESGDAGPSEHSARFFRLAAVWFETPADADRFLERVAVLLAALRLPAGFEFHFSTIGDEFRRAFFEAVAGADFRFVVASFDKAGRDRGRLTKGGIRRATMAAVVRPLAEWYALAEGCKPEGVGLNERVVHDECNDAGFAADLRAAFLGLASGRGGAAKLIRSIKPAKSECEPRVQLADMVCGAVGRHIDGDDTFYRLIRHRAIAVTRLTADRE